jgi:molybdopterin-containing oxidoreductase family iron-sulfur binding subunit
MEKKSLLVDVDLCYGCFSCEVACKQEHGLAVGTNFIKVHQVGPTRIGGKLTMDFVPMACKHCGKPTGCQLCLEACPFGAPQFLAGKDIVQKCDLCVDRTDLGQLPACVHHCPTEALVFGNPNTLPERIQKRRAESVTRERRSSL